MLWLFEPATWIGFITLIVIEIVLGIDNLVFIAILCDRLPQKQQNHARITGLILAMVMRLCMLTLLSWLVTLREPILHIYSLALSGRDIILLVGGIFLLFKATSELHKHLENLPEQAQKQKSFPSFWVVVTQIVVLDAIFSMDAVITAVGVVHHLPIMMAAVIVAVAIMVWASRPLAEFISEHPTVIVLCLSFLLMIGLTLIAESVGFVIPKGYLYASIGFSVLIELFNQISHHNLTKHLAQTPLRERTADAILRLLGSRHTEQEEDTVEQSEQPTDETGFGEEERNMVSGVLTLGERTIRSIMTPRNSICWIDTTDDSQKIQQLLRTSPHSYYLICNNRLDDVQGIARAQDLMDDLHIYGRINEESIRQVIVIPESVGVLKTMEQFKTTRGQMALVVDEYGSVEGLVTPIDILEAIAGEFPDENEALSVRQVNEHAWEVAGDTDLYTLEQTLGSDGLVDDDQDYTTLNGLLFERFCAVPKVGQSIDYNNFHFEILRMEGRRIITVKITRLP